MTVAFLRKAWRAAADRRDAARNEVSTAAAVHVDMCRRYGIGEPRTYAALERAVDLKDRVAEREMRLWDALQRAKVRDELRTASAAALAREA